MLWHSVCVYLPVQIRIFIVLTIWLSGATAFASDSLRVSEVLGRIRQLQVKKAGGDFPAGLFPSYREYNGRNITKNDDNPFFTGLVAITLRSLRPYFSYADRQVCDSILADATPAYRLYRNKTGRPTYNFWRTNPTVVFPHSGWLNLMNSTHALADDIDDTAIILLATAAADTTAGQVHAIMQQHVNGGKRKKKSRYKEYRGIPAYSTWFGKRMPVDIDICVLTNVLYMLQHYQLPFTKADSASLHFICQAIDTRHFIDKPSYVSPHYARTPVILYHLSRLMKAGRFDELEARKILLIAEAKKQYAAAVNPMDKVLLAIVLLRWQQPVAAMQWTTQDSVCTYFEENDFVFFIASMASILPDPLRQWLGGTGIGRFSYYCPAYNEALLLEYLVLQQQQKTGY